LQHYLSGSYEHLLSAPAEHRALSMLAYGRGDARRTNMRLVPFRQNERATNRYLAHIAATGRFTARLD
jgi:hypothetical protein